MAKKENVTETLDESDENKEDQGKVQAKKIEERRRGRNCIRRSDREEKKFQKSLEVKSSRPRKCKSHL